MRSVPGARFPRPDAASLVLAAGLLVATAVAPHAALAVTATDRLGPELSAARLLQVTCADDGAGAPASLAVSVRDLAPVAAPIVSIQIRKDTAATNASDAVDADASPSPVVWLDGGAGTYDVYVNKSAAGEEDYEVQVQCFTGAGGTGSATGTTLSGLPSPVPAASAAGRLLLLGALAALARRRLAPARSGPREGRGPVAEENA